LNHKKRSIAGFLWSSGGIVPRNARFPPEVVAEWPDLPGGFRELNRFAATIVMRAKRAATQCGMNLRSRPKAAAVPDDAWA
jgi:hypothetical protein